MQLDAAYHINVADDSLDNRGFIHRCLFSCSASETTHAHLEVFSQLFKVSKVFKVSQLNLSVSPLLSSSQRKVCRTSYHSSDFQFVSDSTQRPNTIHRQTKDSLRKQTSVLCRTHTCQSITATAHLFKQSKETGSYLPYFYLRYNMCSISLRTCH